MTTPQDDREAETLQGRRAATHDLRRKLLDVMTAGDIPRLSLFEGAVRAEVRAEVRETLDAALGGRTAYHFWEWISTLENEQGYTNEVTALLGRLCGVLGMPDPPGHLTFPRGSTASREALAAAAIEAPRHATDEEARADWQAAYFALADVALKQQAETRRAIAELPEVLDVALGYSVVRRTDVLNVLASSPPSEERT